MPKYEYERHERMGLMGRLASFFRSAVQRFNLKDEMEYLSERLEHLSDRIERFAEKSVGEGRGKAARARTATKRVSRPAVAARRAGAKKAKKPVPPEVSAKKSAAGKKGAAVRWGKVSKKGAGTRAKKTTTARGKKTSTGKAKTSRAKKETTTTPSTGTPS